MHKRKELTEEQFFRHRFRYTKAVAIAYLITIAAGIYIVWFMFFAYHGVLRNCHIAHFVTAGVIFVWVRNTIALPKTLLTKGRKGVQFHPQWVSLCYDRLPQRLKSIVNRERSKQPDMQPEEALLRIANKLNLISFAFYAAALVSIAIGLYRLYSNSQELAYILYFKEVLEVISS